MKIEQSILDSIRSRPRFKIHTDISKENYAQYLKSYIQENERAYTGNVNTEISVICAKTDQDAYWKPCLTLRAEQDEDERKTLITGIFGPTSAVWTFFMFLYFILAILWMVFFTLWFVERQIKSDDFPWALPVSFVMLALLAATYTAARIGKLRAKKEMQHLRKFAEESIIRFERDHAADQAD